MPSHIDAIEKVLKHEGGFVNIPQDRGGATNFGITKKVYDEWMRKRTGNPKYESTIDEIKKMPRGNAILIYKENYWDKIKGDQIKDYAAAFLIFDAAVNSGVSQAIRTAQRILGIVPDGVAGSEFLKHLNNSNPKDFAQKYLKEREDFYKALVAKNPSQKIFEKGWLNRVKDNLAYVSNWIGTPVGKAAVGGFGILILGLAGFFLFRFLRRNKG